MYLKIATRTSKLALVQTHMIATALQAKRTDLNIEIIPVLTTGDQIHDKSLAELGGKGLFVKGLEEKLLTREADIAMHSLKDVPPELASSFCIAAVLKRHAPNDVFVSAQYKNLGELPSSAIVGTSSVRRKAALLHYKKDLNIQMIRGNVDTRLRKLHDREFDALILAEAGLQRLGLTQHIQAILSIEMFPPSVGQGIIAIECLTERRDLIELLQLINDEPTMIQMRAERALMHALNASCTSPVGCFANIISDRLHLTATVWDLEGTKRLDTQQIGALEQAESIGVLAAQDLIQKGARSLLSLPE